MLRDFHGNFLIRDNMSVELGDLAKSDGYSAPRDGVNYIALRSGSLRGVMILWAGFGSSCRPCRCVPPSRRSFSIRQRRTTRPGDF